MPVAAIVLRPGATDPGRRGADRVLPATASPGSRSRSRSSGSRPCRGPPAASSGGPSFAPVSTPSTPREQRHRATRRRAHRVPDVRRRPAPRAAPPRHAVDRGAADRSRPPPRRRGRHDGPRGRPSRERREPCRRPAPIDVAVHVDDLAAILDAEGAADGRPRRDQLRRLPRPRIRGPPARADHRGRRLRAAVRSRRRRRDPGRLRGRRGRHGTCLRDGRRARPPPRPS